jgi:hypothetical protein
MKDKSWRGMKSRFEKNDTPASYSVHCRQGSLNGSVGVCPRECPMRESPSIAWNHAAQGFEGGGRFSMRGPGD